jgi:hypothetical protein
MSVREQVGNVLGRKSKKSKRKKRKKNWIAGAVKNPGALTRAAKRNGRSKLQEAEVESHSSNPSIRSRGNLGKRFIKGSI